MIRFKDNAIVLQILSQNLQVLKVVQMMRKVATIFRYAAVSAPPERVDL
jgi:hypothetical protein